MLHARFDTSIKTAAAILPMTVIVARTHLLLAESRQNDVRNWTAISDVITQREALGFIFDVVILIVIVLQKEIRLCSIPNWIPMLKLKYSTYVTTKYQQRLVGLTLRFQQ